jgi:hypothetical protein
MRHTRYRFAAAGSFNDGEKRFFASATMTLMKCD